MTIGERIKISREKAGLTQNKLGELIGTDGNTISRWERGVMEIKAETISKIALALNISIAYIMRETDDPRPWQELTSQNINATNSNVTTNNHSMIGTGDSKNTFSVQLENLQQNQTLPKQALSDDAIELLQIYNSLDVEQRMKLLRACFKSMNVL